MTVRFHALVGAALSALILGGAGAKAQAPTPAYRLAATVPLGAPDRWDYVVYDPGSHRVFVAHGDRLTVVDARANKVVGEVAGVAGGTHGTAVSAANGRGYTDDGKAGEAVAFDLKTLQVVKRIPAAEDADGIVADPATGRIFVMDGDSGKVTAIDPKADAQIANIDLGGKLEAGAVDGRGRLYVNGAEKREIIEVDTRSTKVLARWPIPSCVSPHGTAIDAAGHRLFVTCINSQMVVLNTDSGATVATVPIGKGSDAAAWDPKRRLVFSSNGLDGNISVIRQATPDSYVALTPIPTTLSARTMDVDPASGRLFVAALDLEPAATPGARPRPKPGTLRLMVFEPVN